jgi:hypothetical protein
MFFLLILLLKKKKNVFHEQSLKTSEIISQTKILHIENINKEDKKIMRSPCA